MVTQKGKPRGAFDFLLAIDCETTGLCFEPSPTPVFNPATGERHQAISWGIVVADAQTLKPVDELYLEVKWNDASKAQRKKNSSFGKKAEEVHGLEYAYLEKNGVTEEEAVVKIGNLIATRWGTTAVHTLGHNVHLFDLPFLRDLFDRYEIEFRYGNRHYDTNSIGFATFGTFNSDQFFEAVGFEKRGDHNALTDAKQALEAARIVRTIFKSAIE